MRSQRDDRLTDPFPMYIMVYNVSFGDRGLFEVQLASAAAFLELGLQVFTTTPSPRFTVLTPK